MYTLSIHLTTKKGKYKHIFKVVFQTKVTKQTQEKVKTRKTKKSISAEKKLKQKCLLIIINVILVLLTL